MKFGGVILSILLVVLLTAAPVCAKAENSKGDSSNDDLPGDEDVDAGDVAVDIIQNYSYYQSLKQQVVEIVVLDSNSENAPGQDNSAKQYAPGQGDDILPPGKEDPEPGWPGHSGNAPGHVKEHKCKNTHQSEIDFENPPANEG